MAKPQLEFHLPTAKWEPAGPEGFWVRILAEDPDSGDYTRLARLDPRTDTSELGPFSHDFHEEVVIIDGDLTDLALGETFTSGMYSCRPPGMLHGPYRTRSGCLLVEFRYGIR